MFDSSLHHLAIAQEQRRKRRSQIIGFLLAVVLLTPVGMALATLAGFHDLQRLLLAPFIPAVLLVAGLTAVKAVQWVSTVVLTAVIAPGGSARGAKPYSRAQSLAARGLMEEATAEFDALRASGSESVSSLRAEAELHSSSDGNPTYAETLFLRLRKSKHATPSDQLYASHRLIDLYAGPLNDPGRMMVELRRMADRFPDTVDGQGALAELKRRRDAST